MSPVSVQLFNFEASFFSQICYLLVFPENVQGRHVDRAKSCIDFILFGSLLETFWEKRRVFVCVSSKINFAWKFCFLVETIARASRGENHQNFHFSGTQRILNRWAPWTPRDLSLAFLTMEGAFLGIGLGIAYLPRLSLNCQFTEYLLIPWLS